MCRRVISIPYCAYTDNDDNKFLPKRRHQNFQKAYIRPSLQKAYTIYQITVTAKLRIISNGVFSPCSFPRMALLQILAAIGSYTLTIQLRLSIPRFLLYGKIRFAICHQPFNLLVPVTPLPVSSSSLTSTFFLLSSREIPQLLLKKSVFVMNTFVFFLQKSHNSAPYSVTLCVKQL